ncbi:MAG: glycosyltransferase family 2 protein [Candidatus Stahlbacteria bacterium]|nr:glycosyltransferase family 2 protein [Candidatus Stahlbacteria bacterium]
MKLSIIIVNYNTKSYLRDTLFAIYDYPPNLKFEVIVVDNASKDNSYYMLKKNFPQVRTIKNTTNVGFARANNQAIPRATGNFILFLNPDAVPEPGAINKLVHFINETPYCGCVGGKLLNPDDSLQLSCRSFPTYISVFFGRQSVFRKMFPGNPFSKGFLLTELDYNKTQKVDWIIGACLLTHREILEQYGYFDEQFFLFVEDLDFCYRIKKNGLDIYYFPDAVFKHHHGVSTRRYWLRSTIQHNLGMYKFFYKAYNMKLLLQGLAVIVLSFRMLCIICMQSIRR